jgi:hypothetical protein
MKVVLDLYGFTRELEIDKTVAEIRVPMFGNTFPFEMVGFSNSGELNLYGVPIYRYRGRYNIFEEE